MRIIQITGDTMQQQNNAPFEDLIKSIFQNEVVRMLETFT